MIGPRHIRRILHAALGLAVCAALLIPAGAEAQRTRAMREKVYERLSRAQEAVDADDFDEAIDQLERLEKMKDLSPGEKAQMYTAFGYLYFAQEQYDEAAAAYERVLDQEDLTEAMRTSTLYTLGQLQFHLERYEAALGFLQRWLNEAENAGPEPYILMGQALYQLGRLDEAAAPVQRAIEISRQREQPVSENWYALLRVIYYETGDFEKLIEVLEILIEEYPAKEYWLHMASAYGELGDSEKQLAVYEAAHELGYLESGPEIVLLCQLLLQAEVPHRAGVLLQAGLEDGRIENTAAHWRLAAQAWQLAHENEKAIAALQSAAELSEDGEIHARIAQSYANLDRWEAAAAAAATAIDRGVRDPGELHMLRGMAFFELGHFTEAKAAFGKAQASGEGRDQASRWLAYVEREEARLKELGIDP